MFHLFHLQFFLGQQIPRRIMNGGFKADGARVMHGHRAADPGKRRQTRIEK